MNLYRTMPLTEFLDHVLDRADGVVRDLVMQIRGALDEQEDTEDRYYSKVDELHDTIKTRDGELSEAEDRIAKLEAENQELRDELAQWEDGSRP